mmetsp:Transcript_77440/g.173326  ORF Transcript_77440/g.173326 Transcript_77440/m.173326 type:complete len:327 (+) Transcript_77440:187-1167(+)
MWDVNFRSWPRSLSRSSQATGRCSSACCCPRGSARGCRRRCSAPRSVRARRWSAGLPARRAATETNSNVHGGSLRPRTPPPSCQRRQGRSTPPPRWGTPRWLRPGPRLHPPMGTSSRWETWLCLRRRMPPAGRPGSPRKGRRPAQWCRTRRPSAARPPPPPQSPRSSAERRWPDQLRACPWRVARRAHRALLALPASCHGGPFSSHRRCTQCQQLCGSTPPCEPTIPACWAAQPSNLAPLGPRGGLGRPAVPDRAAQACRRGLPTAPPASRPRHRPRHRRAPQHPCCRRGASRPRSSGTSPGRRSGARAVRRQPGRRCTGAATAAR